MGYAGKRRAEGVGDNGKAKRRKGQDGDDNIIDLVGATGQGELSQPWILNLCCSSLYCSSLRSHAFQSSAGLAVITPFSPVPLSALLSDGWGVSGGCGAPDDQPGQGTRQDRLRRLVPAQV